MQQRCTSRLCCRCGALLIRLIHLAHTLVKCNYRCSFRFASLPFFVVLLLYHVTRKEREGERRRICCTLLTHCIVRDCIARSRASACAHLNRLHEALSHEPAQPPHTRGRPCVDGEDCRAVTDPRSCYRAERVHAEYARDTAWRSRAYPAHVASGTWR